MSDSTYLMLDDNPIVGYLVLACENCVRVRSFSGSGRHTGGVYFSRIINKKNSFRVCKFCQVYAFGQRECIEVYARVLE